MVIIFAINLQQIEVEIESELLTIVQRTTHHIIDFVALQNENSKQLLLELMQTLFDQFRNISQAHSIFLNLANKAKKTYKYDLKLYELKDVWMKIQYVVSKYFYFISGNIQFFHSCSY